MPDVDARYYSELVKQIGLGLNICRTYPKGHPSLIPIVQKIKLMLKELPLDKESISMVVMEDSIMIDEDRYDSKHLPVVKSLIDRFNQINVKSITLNVDVADDHLREFFGAMAASPAEIADYGDVVAMLKAKGVIGVKVNKFRVGVVASDYEVQEVNWTNLLESFSMADVTVSDEDRVKQLGNFLAGVGIGGAESPHVQSAKVIAGLEKIALVVADQYGEGRWDEYSLVFSRILSVLSPAIKKNIIEHKTENKKLAALFRSLIPTLPEEDIIDIIVAKAKAKSPETEQEIIDILKHVTGANLPGILSTMRVNAPQLDFEKIVARLMSEIKTTKDTREVDKFATKTIEMEIRRIFPSLREPAREKRISAIEDLMKFLPRLLEQKNDELLTMLIDRFDTMADAETDIKTFERIMDSLKVLYRKLREQKNENLVMLISKKFGKHLMRKEGVLLEKKKYVIGVIADIGDPNYLAEMVSLLWDQGTFVEARESLVKMAEVSTPLLVATLSEAEDRPVRMKIIDVLIKIGARAVPEISKMLASTDWHIRRNGIYILGSIGDEKSIEAIGALIVDPEEKVQYEAVEALARRDRERVKGYLAGALDSKFPAVVVAAMKVADLPAARRRLPDLAKWVKAKRTIPDEKVEKSRQEMLSVIGRVGDDSVLDLLVEIISERAIFKGDLLLATKESAINALAQIGTEKAVEALRAVAKHRDAFVAETAKTLVKKFEQKIHESAKGEK